MLKKRLLKNVWAVFFFVLLYYMVRDKNLYIKPWEVRMQLQMHAKKGEYHYESLD